MVKLSKHINMKCKSRKMNSVCEYIVTTRNTTSLYPKLHFDNCTLDLGSLILETWVPNYRKALTLLNININGR